MSDHSAVHAVFAWHCQSQGLPTYMDLVALVADLTTQLAEAQAVQREADAVIAERFVDHYPEDIFLPEGTSVDAQSARVIRLMAPVIADAIRAEGAKE